MSAPDPLADVVPFFELPKLYPGLFGAKHSATWLLRQRDANGLGEYVRWVGRTAFIGKADFARWFHDRTEKPSVTDAQRAASARNIEHARAGRKS